MRADKQRTTDIQIIIYELLIILLRLLEKVVIKIYLITAYLDGF
jgi:hypothetical protein